LSELHSSKPLHRRSAADDGLPRRLAIGLVAVVLVSVALFRGGLSPLALLWLQLLGLALIALMAWQPRPETFERFELALVLAVFLAPLLYLLPLPIEWWSRLPGRDLYVESAALLGDADSNRWRAVSLYPLATQAAWLVLLLPLGVYLVTRSVSEHTVVRLVYVLFGLVSFQVLLAVFQFAAKQSGISYPFVDFFDSLAPSGTFVNRNHLAGLLEMTLPLALALFLHDFGAGRGEKKGRPRGWRKRLARLGGAGGRPSLIFGILVVLIIGGVVVTRSRTGLVLVMLGILIAALLFARRLGSRASFGLVGQVATVAVAFAVVLGLAPVLDRFSMDSMVANARWSLAGATFDAAGQLVPFGDGPGTFSHAFLLYQPLELGRFFVAHAHNDYLEALFEVGFLGALLFVGFLVLYLRQWRRLLSGDQWPRFRFLQIGAGIGISLMLVHGLFDYNLRVPANLTYFAFIAAIFFSTPARAPVIEKGRRKRRRTGYLKDISPAAADAGDASVDATAEVRGAAKTPFDD
jgi:O-antigen ligase